MKLVPKGKWAQIRLGALVAILLGLCLHFHVYGLAHLLRYEPRAGDIVFQSLPRGPLVDAIEGITGSPYSHCGVVMRNAEGRWVVHEAIGTVRETPLHLWIVRGRGARLDVWRWKDIGRHDIPALDAALRRYSGRPYDFRYAPGDDKIYCSELAFKAYRDAYGVELGIWERLGDLHWQPFEAFIREMEGGPPPLDRPMVTPVGMTRSPLLEKIY
ncbi:MAG: YiiX/YebB-like N1pC/P60 family cysteine hydrolase [Verrucomicrobiota bacterium]